MKRQRSILNSAGYAMAVGWLILWLGSVPTLTLAAPPTQLNQTVTPVHHIYLLFDVSGTMGRVDGERQRYQVLSTAFAALAPGGSLSVYTFSDRLAGHSYSNDGLLPRPGEENYSEFRREPYAPAEVRRLEDFLERTFGRSDQIRHQGTFWTTTAPESIDRLRDRLMSSQGDWGGFTDFAEVLNAVYFQSILPVNEKAPGGRPQRHHILLATDGLPDPFPDYEKEGTHQESYADRIDKLRSLLANNTLSRAVDRFNAEDSVDPFLAEMNRFKVEVHGRRIRAIQHKLLEAGADIYILPFPSQGKLSPAEENQIRAFLVNSHRVQLVSPGQGNLLEALLAKLMDLGPQAGFTEILELQPLKDPEIDQGVLRKRMTFPIDQPVLEATIFLRWNAASCGSKSPALQSFHVDVDLGHDDSGRMESYRIGQTAVSSGDRQGVAWSGTEARLRLKEPQAGTWWLELAIPAQTFSADCFHFDIHGLGSLPSLIVPEGDLQVGSGDRCGIGGTNEYEVPLDLGAYEAYAASGTLRVQIVGFLTRDQAAESIRPIPARESAGARWFCIPLQVDLAESGDVQVLTPGEYRLLLETRLETPNYAQTVEHHLDVRFQW